MKNGPTMKKVIIAITAIVVIGIIEVVAIVYQVNGGGLAAAIGGISAIATWRAIKSVDERKPPPSSK